MMQFLRGSTGFLVFAGLIAFVGFWQSWNTSLTIVNFCLISGVMALGLNMQWGYAGLFNAGVMGFAALGGLAVVLISQPPVAEAWVAGGWQVGLAGLMLAALIFIAYQIYKRMAAGFLRKLVMAVLLVGGYVAITSVYLPAIDAIERVEPAKTGYLGGLGLPVIMSWIVGGALAAGAAWVVGKISLGLRSDYLAIATLGISEIIIAMLKNEDWLARGVKNVTGLPRPVPYELELQQAEWFVAKAAEWGHEPAIAAGLFVKLSYALLFAAVLIILLIMAEKAQRSPWGRMMRAIRDNEVSANAMGKDVTKRHLEVFILGSAIIGVAGAMLTTIDGQFTPGTYNPLRFTFLIWVMVIVGGSGNNWGAILGGFIVWFLWVEAAPIGFAVMDYATSFMPDDSAFRDHLLKSAPHLRLMIMGLVLLLVMRFSPKGMIPERNR